jgi:hypothetical protein
MEAREGKEDNMRSTMVTVIAGAALVGLAAQAQEAAGPSDTARYSFHRVDDGFLRLDVRNGQVSQCKWVADGWFCRAVPDERRALEAEIARLVASNAALKKELLARGLPLPDGIKPDPPAGKSDGDSLLPSEAELDRMLGHMEKVWKRLIEMMSNLQRDIRRKT